MSLQTRYTSTCLGLAGKHHLDRTHPGVYFAELTDVFRNAEIHSTAAPLSPHQHTRTARSCETGCHADVWAGRAISVFGDAVKSKINPWSDVHPIPPPLTPALFKNRACQVKISGLELKLEDGGKEATGLKVEFQPGNFFYF